MAAEKIVVEISVKEYPTPEGDKKYQAFLDFGYGEKMPLYPRMMDKDELVEYMKDSLSQHFEFVEE